MSKIINLTPHSINIIVGDKNIVIEPSGNIARVSTETVVIGEIAGIPITTTKFGEVENLPEPDDDTIYIVSLAVAQRCCISRDDVYIPNESIRNEKGQIIGCRSIGKI